jgi:hypothetical protein
VCRGGDLLTCGHLQWQRPKHDDERQQRVHVCGAPRGAAVRWKDGWTGYILGSYFVVPKKLQLVAKWVSFDPGQIADDDLHSITGGVNYYIHGDDLKLMADYIHTWSDFRSSHPQFGDDQFDELLLRLQLIF